MLASRFLIAFTVFVTVIGCAARPVAENPRSPFPSDGSAPVASQRGLVPAVVGLPPDPGDELTYRLSPGDTLRIEVFQVADLSGEETVNDDGSIILPLIGSLRVAGLTPEEAERSIAAALAKDYLQDPQVGIRVTQFANRSFTVAGAVTAPGVFPLTGRTTLMQAIALARGINDVGDDRQVTLFREPTGKPVNAYVIDLKRVQRGELADPLIVSNDKVLVPRSGSAVFLKGLTGGLRGFVSMPIPVL